MPKRPPSSSAARKPAKSPPPPGPAWKPAQRAALAGSRRPHPLDPAPPPLTRDEGWARLLEAERAEDARCGPVKIHNPSAEALYEPIRTSYAQAEPPARLDPQVERLRANLLQTHPVEDHVNPAWQALLAFWVGTEGLGFVFDVCNAPEPWSYWTQGLTRILVGPPEAMDTRGRGWGRMGNGNMQRELRRLLFALPEPAFVKARDEAMEWLERRPEAGEAHERENERAAIAHALARDPTLAHATVRGMLDRHGYLSEIGHMLASITDLALARELVGRYAMVMDIAVAFVALDVVETFGRDAADLLQKILDVAASRPRKMKPFYKGRLEAAVKLALTDPRPPTP